MLAGREDARTAAREREGLPLDMEAKTLANEGARRSLEYGAQDRPMEVANKVADLQAKLEDNSLAPMRRKSLEVQLAGMTTKLDFLASSLSLEEQQKLQDIAYKREQIKGAEFQNSAPYQEAVLGEKERTGSAGENQANRIKFQALSQTAKQVNQRLVEIDKKLNGDDEWTMDGATKKALAEERAELKARLDRYESQLERLSIDPETSAQQPDSPPPPGAEPSIMDEPVEGMVYRHPEGTRWMWTGGKYVQVYDDGKK